MTHHTLLASQNGRAYGDRTMSMRPREVDHWLEAYGEDHRHPVNKQLHNICVPLIVVSLIALLWSIPVPAAFTGISPALNWGTAFLLSAVVYYFILSLWLALGMLPFILLTTAMVIWLESLPQPLWLTAGLLFAVAWAGQFIGHWFEGARPSFFRDLQFLMIGPLWLLARFYRWLGLRY